MKKISLVLAMILALALLAPLSVAAEGEALVYLEADPTTAGLGDTVEVTFSLDDNPGVAGGEIHVFYDPDVFYIADEEEDIFDTGRQGTRISFLATKVYDGEKAGDVGFVFGQATNVTRNGGIGTIVFTVKDDAVTGDYDFSVTVPQFMNADKQNVPVTTDGCTVHVDGITAGPTVDDIDLGINATADGTVAQANIIVDLADGIDVDDVVVTIDGAPATLIAQADGTYKIPTGAKPAKQFGDEIAYSITYGGETKSGTTSLAAYAQGLAASEQADVAALGEAMLNYAAAAQVKGNYNTDNLVGDPAAAPAITAAMFDTTALQAALADAPVYYSAFNVVYLNEITFKMAFTVKKTATVDEAAEWVEANIKIGDKTASVEHQVATNGAYDFIIVTIEGIGIDEILDDMDITVGNTAAGTVSVANYLAAVENAYASKPAKANELNLARALYAYALALDAIQA